jgi:hypothetical protein
MVNKKLLLFGLPALLVTLVGYRYWQALVVGVILLSFYARAKGYSVMIGVFLGFLSFIGAAILIFLPDRNEPGDLKFDNPFKSMGKILLALGALFAGTFVVAIGLILLNSRNGQSLEVQTNQVGFWFMAVVVAVALSIYFFRGQSGRELKLVKAAAKALKSDDFEGACYYYAGAVLSTPSRWYYKKYATTIKHLYCSHGPFTFDRWKRDLETGLAALQKEGDNPESCGESGLAMEWVFHEILVEKILEIIEDRLTAVQWPRRIKLLQEWEVTSGCFGTVVRPISTS